jgi:hypothetical protein
METKDLILLAVFQEFQKDSPDLRSILSKNIGDEGHVLNQILKELEKEGLITLNLEEGIVKHATSNVKRVMCFP